MSESRRDFFRNLLRRDALRPLVQIALPLQELSDLAEEIVKPEISAEDAGLELGRRNDQLHSLAFLLDGNASQTRATGSATPARNPSDGNPKEAHGENPLHQS